MLTPVAGAVVPLTQLQSLIQDMLTPVAGAVVPLTQLQSDLYSFLLGSDVIALIQDMLTSVAGAVVPLTQLQSDLYSFLVGIAGMEPAAALGGLAGAGLSPAADASVASLWRLVLPFAAIPGGPLAGNATGVAPLGGIAASIFAAMTQLAANGAISMGLQSFFRPAYSEPLLTGSLAGLAAVALPGAAGLASLTQPGCYPFHWRRWPLSLCQASAGLRSLPQPGCASDTARPKPVSRCGQRASRASPVRGPFR